MIYGIISVILLFFGIYNNNNIMLLSASLFAIANAIFMNYYKKS